MLPPRAAKVEQLAQRIADFEQASGCSLQEWDDAKKVGAAVKMVLTSGDRWTGLRNGIGALETALEAAKKADAEIRKVKL